MDTKTCKVCHKEFSRRINKDKRGNSESVSRFKKRPTCSPTCGSRHGHKYKTEEAGPLVPKLCKCGCGQMVVPKPGEYRSKFNARPYVDVTHYYAKLAHTPPGKYKRPEPKPKVAKPKPKPELSPFVPDAKLPTPKVLLKQQQSVSAPKPTRYRWCDKHNERIGAYGCTGCNVEKRRLGNRKYDVGDLMYQSGFSITTESTE